ncbi:MotB family protein [Bradyrhizobium canariense]|uniref:MotB family protein n=1 Tax=Bradyrhizobium TaxID=374 RepID=UPI001CA5C1D4|nr:MotB family protein [Bradyrhizobium canariense]MBW5434875.1 MotB family protein [Bradyrhizobium canariense]
MNEVKSELVIIRRRSAFDDEKPHGGVWKIAYADFMTAMMAFFLVMWLINALNQDQKQVVASYFNPIKLAENAPAPKGLKDLSKKEPSSFDGQDGRRQPGGPSEERRGDSPTAEKPPFYEEKVLFRDPYTTLAEIASSANQASGQRRAGALTSAEEDGLKGGDAYRDPFDPGYWKLAPQATKDADRIIEGEPKPKPEPEFKSNASTRDTASGTGQGEPQARRARQDDAGGSVAPNGDASSGSLSPLLPPGPASSLFSREGSAQPGAQAGNQANAAAQPRPNDATKESEPRDAVQAQQLTVKQLQSAIADALSDVKAGAGPVAEVRQVEEGLLISLTDDANFGMFAVGSAEPRPELIRVIDKIGPLLTKRPGVIIVRGHTDNRPYRSETYDNWRLSTARAQMAYYMLVRSGVDAQRIEHVEGYADRRPKLQNDPAAAQNRRIEIMVREKRP